VAAAAAVLGELGLGWSSEPSLAAGVPARRSRSAPVRPTKPNPSGPRSLPHPPPAKLRRASPELCSTCAGRPPRGHIAKGNFFSRVFLQRGNSNSKLIFLFLVNCIENRRKIRKMQNQFCWILCELSYNVCYFCMKNTNVKNLDLQYV
jgi:hypothetical protein